MSTIFDLAAPPDVSALLGMMRELYEYDHTPFHENEHRIALEELMANESFGCAWVIRSDGTVVGYVILTFGYSLEFRGRDAFVDELFVSGSYRGRGIGTQALEFVERAARELGIKALHLEVAHSNIRAQEVYRKFGYRDHDRYLITKWVR